MSIFTISQTLKYHKVNEDTCPRPLFLPMRLQALTSEDDNYNYATPALQSKSTASSISEDVENSISENVPTDELDHKWMEVPFIVTDSETLPEVPLDKSVLENITSHQYLQLSECSAGSDLMQNLDCTFEYNRVNISDEESILNNG